MQVLLLEYEAYHSVFHGLCHTRFVLVAFIEGSKEIRCF